MQSEQVCETGTIAKFKIAGARVKTLLSKNGGRTELSLFGAMSSHKIEVFWHPKRLKFISNVIAFYQKYLRFTETIFSTALLIEVDIHFFQGQS